METFCMTLLLGCLVAVGSPRTDVTYSGVSGEERGRQVAKNKIQRASIQLWNISYANI